MSSATYIQFVAGLAVFALVYANHLRMNASTWKIMSRSDRDLRDAPQSLYPAAHCHNTEPVNSKTGSPRWFSAVLWWVAMPQPGREVARLSTRRQA